MQRLIVTVLLVGALGGGGFYIWGRARAATPQQGAGKAPAPVPVLAAPVMHKDVPIYLDALGTVQAFASVTVRTQVDGQIMKIYFKEGQDVKKGDLLAQIDPAPLQAQLEQANAHKKQDEAKVVQDRAKVNQDQAKSKQDMAKKVQDEASLNNAKVTAKRYEDTVVANAVTRQQVDDAHTAVATLTALVEGDGAAIQADEAAVQADLAAIQADEATVQADEANIRYSQTQLNFTKITSPLDGRIGIRFVDEGNVVHTNDQNGLVLVTQLQPISVLFTLPQQDLQKINARMEHEKLPVFAVDSAGAMLDRGELELVDNQIDPTTGTIRLKSTFPNSAHKLWPGGFVNVRLLLDTRANAIVVAAPAVQQGPDGNYVYQINGDVVQAQPVTLALIQDGEAVIEGGLNAGDSVVLSGQDRLKNGSHVNIQGTKGAKSDQGKGGAEPGEHKREHKSGDKPANAEKSENPEPPAEASGAGK